ncbi:MarC family protein [Bdellovibrio sp. KM01]|uniref:MarC family protein n=1 Tax=Bdellovibrio sp. KM01 TaxID=2748865 RepID=UPI0015EA5725|nr:MarC family protein [Bdellovibrio sp. KM01]QLY26766.1 MarC family protein [Bdellovibrio sp. KM01]
MNSISIASFYHYVFVCLVALFPPVNPFGTAFIVGPFLKGLSTRRRMQSAAAIAIYCLGICITFTLLGGFFFKLFGISVPVVQIAGGMLIARMGFSILSATDPQEDQEKVVDNDNAARNKSLKSMLFYPLAFPTTTGGGTISVLMALSANSYHENHAIHMFNLLATSVACVILALIIFACYSLTPTILDRLNLQALQVANKFSGFLTFCVGIQIMVDGVLGVAKILIKG